MNNKRNYYRILHVQPDAPKEIIQSSYRTLMQKLKAHPDLGGEDWNAAIINEAYKILIDSEKRHTYDVSLFKVKGHDELGKQHHNQRYETESNEDDGWRPFKPKVIDNI